MNVKRYDTDDSLHGAFMTERIDGDYVSYNDYLDLHDELIDTQLELRRLREVIKNVYLEYC